MILAIAQFTISVISDGLGIQSTTIDYAVSSSGVTPPGNIITDGSGNPIMSNDGKPLTDGDWTTTLPTVPQGMYLWTRTRFVLTNGSFDMIYNVSYAGEDGPQGEDAPTPTHIYREFRLSDSSTSMTGIGAGYSWSTTQPKIESGQYLWKREVTEYSDGSTLYSNAFCETTLSGVLLDVDRDSKAIAQKVWASDITNSINEYDGSTGKAIRDRVTKTEQDIGTITSTVSDVQSTLSTKADGSTVTTLQQTVSTNEQTASQFRQTVQSDYAKLTDVDTIINNIKIGGNNLYVIKDEVPGYIHGTSGAISTQSASYKEVTSSFIPVKPGESYILQSWATPTTSGKSWLAYQYYSDNSGTPFGSRVSKYGDTLDSGVEVTADGQEHLTYKITIPNDVSYLRMSYRKYNDGYAMIEKATTPSEYSMNPEDLQNYTDSVVSSAKSEIKQTTDSISAQVSKKVGTDEIIAKINLSPETATIQASKINLLGQVTFEMLNNAAQTRITNVESTASTASSTATSALNSANLANDKSNQTLAMKVNYSSFSGANNGECYIHGFNENNEPADVNGYIYWKGRKITVAKTMINPDAICPYYKTIYLVLRLSSTTATAGTLYMVWYNSGWKYAVTPTPSAVGGTWTWNENTDIAIGQFVEPGSDGIMFDAYLYYPPRSPYEIVTSRDNAYGYAKGAVDWTSANGSNMTNALSMIKKWTNNAVSDTTTIQGGWIATNTITSSQLATNAIMSTNYEASTTNPDAPYSKYGTFLDLSNGNFWTPNFGVINSTPTGTNVPTGAWFNGTVYANSGRFGEGSSYWNIESVDDYNMTTHAALVGTGNAYLQTGNWQVNDNAVQTRKYVSTAEYSGQTTYYKDTDTNTYYDVGMKIPTDFSQRTSSDGDVATYNKSFFYGRKYTGNNLPSLDSEWTYFFQVDSQGNIYEQGQPLNARYAAIGDVEGQYVSTTGGTVNGNLTVTGTLTATASNATKVGHSLSINNKSFDGSATVNVGTIGVGYGGTGATSFTAGAVLIGNGSNAIQTRSIRNNTTAGSLGWTNSSTDNTLITTNTLAYWNGRYDNTRSNLEYVKLGKLGTVVTHDIEEFITTNGGSVAELTAGNLIVTGEGRFTNGLYGDLTGDVVGNVSGSAGSVENSLKIQLNGGTTEGTNQFTYNGSAAKNINITKSSIGLGNVDNTADANKAVLTATKFASAQSVTLTGDTTGTASSQAGWSIATKTDRISTVGDNRAVATTPNDYSNKIIFQGLKANGYIGSPNSSNTYSYLVGLRGWSDSSGGKSHEVAFNDAGIYRRIGATTTWENWITVLDSNNFNTYAPELDGTGATGTWGISISGNATTATTATTANAANYLNRNTATTTTTGIQYAVGQLTIGSADGNATEGTNSSYKLWSYPAGGTSINSGTTANIQNIRFYWANNNFRDIFISPNNNTIYHRHVTSTSSEWFTILDSNNYNTYAPTKTGTGASGTWGISVTGSAGTAGSLTTGRDFTIGKTKKTAVKWDGAVTFTQAEISDCATDGANGWMSKEDKAKLDSITVSDIGTVGANSIKGATNGGINVSITNGVATIKHTNQLTAGGTAQGTANNSTLTNGGSFTVPTITYDINGHITSTGTNKLTLPSITTITGNAGTATKFNSTRKIELTGNVTGSASADGSSGWSIATTVANNSHTHDVNNITYGNSATSGSLDPITGAYIGSATSNKTFGLPANAITIEYSTNGGSTWTDYGATDSQKRDLFAETRATNFILGKSSSASTNTTNNRLRITIEPTDRYVFVNGIYVWLSSSGSTVYMDLERSSIGAKDTFTTVFTGQQISGWSGNNIRYFSGASFGGGSTQTSNCYKYRITFYQTAVNTSYNSASVSDIRFLGANVWSSPNNMVSKNHLYTWNSSLDATFPAEITATKFNGDLDGNASTATKADSLVTEVGSSNAARPVWFSYQNNNSKAVYNTNFTYNPVGNVVKATTFDGNATSATTATSSYYPKIVAANELRFDVGTKPSSATSLHIGYKWSDGTADAKINRYIFKNGNAQLAEVEASTFYGALSGNATTATTASRVSSAGAGTINANRHVWFSDSATETARNHDDDFVYNPSTNVLTVGSITGTATYATTTADTTNALYPVGVTSGATTTLKRDTSITMTGGAISAARFTANVIQVGLSGTTHGSSTGGLALYTTNPNDHGIAMRGTSNDGKHGYVQGDWAIYSYMSGSNDTNKLTRGWILKNSTDNVGVASVSGAGHAVFNGSVTIGGNATNTSGMRMEFDENLSCTNFVFY